MIKDQPMSGVNFFSKSYDTAWWLKMLQTNPHWFYIYHTHNLHTYSFGSLPDALTVLHSALSPSESVYICTRRTGELLLAIRERLNMDNSDPNFVLQFFHARFLFKHVLRRIPEMWSGYFFALLIYWVKVRIAFCRIRMVNGFTLSS